MRIRYLLLSVGVAMLASFAMTPVSAQPPPYPPSPPSLTVSPATIVGCGNVVLEGTSFGPNELIEVTVVTTPLPGAQSGPGGSGGDAVRLRTVARVVLAQPDRTVRADAAGTFSLTLGLTNIGRAVITATGTESGDSATAVATVVPPTCYPGPTSPARTPTAGMPLTGNSGGRLLLIGVAAVGSGAIVLATGALLWRRRRL